MVNVWSTATDAKVLRELGGGALSEVTTTSGALKTLGSVGAGVAARAIGGVLAAVPASAYLIGREGAELVINGPEAAANDTWALVTAPFDGISKAYDAAQIVHNNDTSDPAKLNAAKQELRSAGANTLPALGMAVGGASGDLGPQALRAATNGAQSTAMAIGRASFGDPLSLEPAYAVGQLPGREIIGAVKGSPTIPSAVAVEGTVVLSQNTGGDGAQEPENTEPGYGEVPHDRAVVSTEVDPVTGKVKVEHWTAEEATNGRTEYDLTTGRRISDSWRDQFLLEDVHVEYNPATGHRAFQTHNDPFESSRIEYYPTGERKSVTVTRDGSDPMAMAASADKVAEHTEFDQAGRQLSEKITYHDGREQTIIYEPSTEHVRAMDWITKDGIRGHAEYDTTTGTGHRKFADYTLVDGTHIHVDYDSTTGRPHFSDRTNKDGTKVLTEYDPESGKRNIVDSTSPDGAKRHLEFDNTGQIVFQDNEYASGPLAGIKMHAKIDPSSGHPKSIDWLLPNGSRVHTEHDSSTGNTLSADLPTGPDGKHIHVKYDPITGNKRSEDWTLPNGATAHVEFGTNGNPIGYYSIKEDGTRITVDVHPETGMPQFIDQFRPDGSAIHTEFPDFDPDTEPNPNSQ